MAILSCGILTDGVLLGWDVGGVTTLDMCCPSLSEIRSAGNHYPTGEYCTTIAAPTQAVFQRFRPAARPGGKPLVAPGGPPGATGRALTTSANGRSHPARARPGLSHSRS